MSNIGSEHFIGLAGSGATIGIGAGAWELNVRRIFILLNGSFVMVCALYEFLCICCCLLLLDLV